MDRSCVDTIPTRLRPIWLVKATPMNPTTSFLRVLITLALGAAAVAMSAHAVAATTRSSSPASKKGEPSPVALKTAASTKAVAPTKVGALTKAVTTRSVVSSTAPAKAATTRSTAAQPRQIAAASRSTAQTASASRSAAGSSSLKLASSSSRSPRMARVSYAPRSVEPARLSIGQAIGLRLVDDPLDLRSSVAMVIDQQTGEAIFQKNADAVLPIASITKVMTAMVVLDAGLPGTDVLEVSEADRDTERHSSSRLPIGSRLSRAELLNLALMSSENRAASALSRNYPGGQGAFVRAMNAKAAAIGMTDSHFSDPTGLSSGNVANARDLARMVRAASAYPLIRQYSTATEATVDLGPRQVTFRSTNRLIDDPAWEIGMQKTGYISEAGKCLVMQARIESRTMIIILLDASGAQSRFADAQRLRRWMTDRLRLDPTLVQAEARS